MKELDEQAARDLTDRIKASQPAAYSLVVEAYRGEAWKALGYPSWVAYCAAEIERPRLPRVQRREAALLLRAAGLTLTATAAALGSPTSTISDDTGSHRKSTLAPVQASNLGGTPLTRQRKAIRTFVGFDNISDFFDADLLRQIPAQELTAFLERLMASRRATEILINEIRAILKEGKQL